MSEGGRFIGEKWFTPKLLSRTIDVFAGIMSFDGERYTYFDHRIYDIGKEKGKTLYSGGVPDPSELGPIRETDWSSTTKKLQNRLQPTSGNKYVTWLNTNKINLDVIHNFVPHYMNVMEYLLALQIKIKKDSIGFAVLRKRAEDFFTTLKIDDEDVFFNTGLILLLLLKKWKDMLFKATFRRTTLKTHLQKKKLTLMQ